MKKINNLIVETYCSLEVSKLLKDRGCDIPSNLIYYDPPKNKNGTHIGFGNKRQYQYYKNTPKDGCERIHGVSHSIAIEWIRLNFNIWIEIRHIKTFGFNRFHVVIWKYGEGDYHSIYTEDGGYIVFESPQNATEAALKYVLNNLVI